MEFRSLCEGTRSFFGGVTCEDFETPVAAQKSSSKIHTRLVALTQEIDLTTKNHTNSSFANRPRSRINANNTTGNLSLLEPGVFHKKQKYNPALKTFSTKATDTSDDYHDVKGTFAL